MSYATVFGLENLKPIMTPIALLLSLASLIWNEVNRRQTNKMVKKLRKESIRLEEFRSTVKDPLRDALSAFEQISMTVEALKSSSQALAKQENKIFKLNEDVISALTRLESRLNDANNSRFADGTKWLHDFEDQQNIVYDELNYALNQSNSENCRRRALQKVQSALLSLRSNANLMIDVEIEALAYSE